MNERTIDRRVSRTRTRLRGALVKLLDKKELREISVSELTSLADINRGTFYLHYRDIFDLYDRMESEVLEELIALVSRHADADNRRELIPVVLDVLEYFRGNAELCMMLLRSGDSGFLNRLLDSVKPTNETEWMGLLGGMDPALRDYFYAFITSGFIGLIKSWFLSGMKESPKEIAALAAGMIPICTALPDAAGAAE